MHCFSPTCHSLVVRGLERVLDLVYPEMTGRSSNGPLLCVYSFQYMLDILGFNHDLFSLGRLRVRESIFVLCLAVLLKSIKSIRIYMIVILKVIRKGRRVNEEVGKCGNIGLNKD